MKRNNILRLLVDGLMTGSVLLAIANKLTENPMHEITGVFMLLWVVIHQVLNRRWYQTLSCGKYDMRHTINAAVNVLLITGMAVLIGSSVMISRTLFYFLGIDSNLALRQIHTTTAYWFMILMAVHIGIHWARLMKMTKKAIFILQKIRVHNHLKRLMAIAIVIAGIHASFDRDMGSKLFMAYTFDFWDFDQSISGFFIRNLSIIGLYVVITLHVSALFNHRKTRKQNMRQVNTHFSSCRF